MGALAQPRPKRVADSLRKGPESEVRKLDRYGRDPESITEILRQQTDYEADTGYSPLYHAMLADLPRLVEGSAAGWALVMSVLRLSAGRSRAPKDPRHTETVPVSTAELSELCRCNVKTIQRQLDEMKERGMIAVKSIKQGGGFVRYVISLRLKDWQKLPDYAVWQRSQVVAIDEAQSEEADDESPAEISKEAVRLTKGRVVVKAGRAVKAKKISVGVNAYKVQSRNSRVAVDYEAVVDSGCLTFIVGSEEGESEAKGESQANVERHACRAAFALDSPAKETAPVSLPRAEEICKIFDPLLQKSGSRLLSPDSKALNEACAAIGAVDHDYLLHFVMGPKGRGSRPISGPRAVVGILRECRENWEKYIAAGAEIKSQERRCACGGPISVDGQCWECASK